MAGIHVAMPGTVLLRSPWTEAGIGVAVIGLCMNLWSASHFRFRGTTMNPHGEPMSLATTGLYRITRNPMYLGMSLVLVGFGVWLGELAPFLIPPGFVWLVTRRFIVAEEQVIENVFGPVYLSYKNRVPRWL